MNEDSNEIFSFHLMKLPLLKIPFFLFRAVFRRNIPGLKHSENFLAMNLGEPIMSFRRFDFRSVAVFAWWSDVEALNAFLQSREGNAFNSGWHVRLKLYRRWGEIRELENVVVDPTLAPAQTTVVAVTLARLNIFQTLRFIKFGKPVEEQVRDHSGKIVALAAMRPFNTFSTFSIWKSEHEMLKMVTESTERHRAAMKERVRKDFHFEFMTMRFAPISESGTWNGRQHLLL